MLRHLLLAAFLALAAVPAWADITVGGGSPGAPPPTTTVAGLPTCDNANQGARRTVTDASSSSTCTSGGGANRNVCRCDDSAWELEGAGAGLSPGDKGDITVGGTWEIDAGVVTSTELADNACKEPELDVLDSPADEEALTYEVTGGRFEWEPRVSGATSSGGLATAGAAGAPTLGLIDCSTNQILKDTGAGTWACAADDSSPGGGDAVSVDNGATVDPNFQDSAAINFTYAAPNISATLVAGGVDAAAIGANAITAGGGELANDAVTESKLDVVDSPADEEYLTYEATGTRFEWQAAPGSSITVDGSPVSSPVLADTGDVNFSASGSDISGALKTDAVSAPHIKSGNTEADREFPTWDASGSTFQWAQGLAWFASAMRPMPDAYQIGPLSANRYERHHWSTSDVRPYENIFSSVDPATLAEAFDPWTGFCPTGQWDEGHLGYLYNLDSGRCEGTHSGTGTNATVCVCAGSDGTKMDMPRSLPPGQMQAHLWTMATNKAETTATLYPTDLANVGYPRPLLRVDASAANECETLEEVNKPVSFQRNDRPVFVARFLMYNQLSPITYATTNTADSIHFIGWKITDPAGVHVPGFDLYVDTTPGTGTAALMASDLEEAFGWLWVGSKWYWVHVYGGVLTSAQVMLDPIATFGSLSNWFQPSGAWNGGLMEFMVQTDVDGQGGNAKKAAYQFGQGGTGTKWHGPFTNVALTAAGTIKSGYATGPGVGYDYHRIMISCLKDGATVPGGTGRFFLNQLDIIK